MLIYKLISQQGEITLCWNESNLSTAMGHSPKFLPVRFWVGGCGAPCPAGAITCVFPAPVARPALLVSGVLCAGAVKQLGDQSVCGAPAWGQQCSVSSISCAFLCGVD